MSSDNSDIKYDVVNSGASNIEQIPVSSIKVWSYVSINEHPCKVKEINRYKVRKNGYAKVAIKGVDIFTWMKIEIHKTTYYEIESPIDKKEICRLINIKGNDLTLQMNDGNLREDLSLP